MDTKQPIDNTTTSKQTVQNISTSYFSINENLNKPSSTNKRKFGKNILNSLALNQSQKLKQPKNKKKRERSRNNSSNNNIKSKTKINPKKIFIQNKISNFAKIENTPFTESDLHYVKEYQNEIFSYLISLENKISVNPNYFNNIQDDINEKMREILVEWLVEIHFKFHLLPETLFLTINIMDRYLQKIKIKRKNLQLVGIASLLIACKYEEIYVPNLKLFVYVTDKAYEKEQLLQMENEILRNLDFDLTYPSPLRFLEILCVKLNYFSEEEKIIVLKMMYLLELTFIRVNFYKYTKIELIIACCVLSNKNKNDFLEQNFIKRCIKEFSIEFNEKKVKNIMECVKELSILAKDTYEGNNISYGSIRKKYMLEKNQKVFESKFW